MFKFFGTTIAIIFLSMAFRVNAEDAPASIKWVLPTLEAWGRNPVLVKAVKAHNGEKLTLDTIKKTDEEWQATSGVDAFMKELMSNFAAKELQKLEATMPFLFECFLMGDQGENIAMTNKTSDYWQGDEEKFTKSFNAGKGQIRIGKVKFDSSAQAYQVQVSIPVKEGAATIGVIIIGVNLDDYEASLE